MCNNIMCFLLKGASTEKDVEKNGLAEERQLKGIVCWRCSGQFHTYTHCMYLELWITNLV